YLVRNRSRTCSGRCQLFGGEVDRLLHCTFERGGWTIVLYAQCAPRSLGVIFEDNARPDLTRLKSGRQSSLDIIINKFHENAAEGQVYDDRRNEDHGSVKGELLVLILVDANLDIFGSYAFAEKLIKIRGSGVKKRTLCVVKVLVRDQQNVRAFDGRS